MLDFQRSKVFINLINKTMEKLNKFMEGKKTYFGLLLTVLGIAGLGGLISGDELNVLADSIMKIAGILIAVYGRIVALPKK